MRYYSRHIDRIAHIFMLLTFFVLPLSTALTNIFYLSTVVLILLTGDWVQRRKLLYTHPIVIAFWLFWLLSVVGILFSTASTAEAAQGVIKHRWLLLTPLFLPLLLQKQWRAYAVYFFVTGIILSLLVSLSLDYYNFKQEKIYCSGILNTPVLVHSSISRGLSFSFVAVLLLYWAINNKPYRYLLLTFAVLLMGYTLLINTSLTGYIVLATLLLYFFMRQFSVKSFGVVVFTLGLLFLVLFFVSDKFNTRIMEVPRNTQSFLSGDSNSSTGMRLEQYRNAILLIEQRPFLGYGTNGIKSVYEQLPEKKRLNTLDSRYIDNLYLNQMTQFGFVGLLALFALFFIQWLKSFDVDDELKFIMQMILIAFMVGGLFNQWFTAFFETYFYALFSMLVFATLPNVNANVKQLAPLRKV